MGEHPPQGRDDGVDPKSKMSAALVTWARRPGLSEAGAGLARAGARAATCTGSSQETPWVTRPVPPGALGMLSQKPCCDRSGAASWPLAGRWGSACVAEGPVGLRCGAGGWQGDGKAVRASRLQGAGAGEAAGWAQWSLVFAPPAIWPLYPHLTLPRPRAGHPRLSWGRRPRGPADRESLGPRAAPLRLSPAPADTARGRVQPTGRTSRPRRAPVLSPRPRAGPGPACPQRCGPAAGGRGGRSRWPGRPRRQVWVCAGANAAFPSRLCPAQVSFPSSLPGPGMVASQPQPRPAQSSPWVFALIVLARPPPGPGQPWVSTAALVSREEGLGGGGGARVPHGSRDGGRAGRAGAAVLSSDSLSLRVCSHVCSVPRVCLTRFPGIRPLSRASQIPASLQCEMNGRVALLLGTLWGWTPT